MAVCTWDGDVWRVDGLGTIGQPDSVLRWRRIATGLFQPLGILVDGDRLMVSCRDQLVSLGDSNGDGEMDDYRCFNSDHQVTEHFHEFAMGLQRDDEGNFYYAKSARHALPAVVPHHGTLLRVPASGESTDILATGFRAANGVCLNDDGSFIVTDQEGHWNPKNRINWVRPGGFYGNMYGYHDVTDSSDDAMEQPLCWITNEFDRSPAELLWANTDRWGPLGGQLLNLSYGYGRIYVVPHEHVSMPTGDRQPQGGMCQLPIPDLPTGMIRGRFSPHDGQLYVGGMFSWAGSRQDQEGGLFRVRYKGGRVDMPVALASDRRRNRHYLYGSAGCRSGDGGGSVSSDRMGFEADKKLRFRALQRAYAADLAGRVSQRQEDDPSFRARSSTDLGYGNYASVEDNRWKRVSPSDSQHHPSTWYAVVLEAERQLPLPRRSRFYLVRVDWSLLRPGGL